MSLTTTNLTSVPATAAGKTHNQFDQMITLLSNGNLRTQEENKKAAAVFAQFEADMKKNLSALTAEIALLREYYDERIAAFEQQILKRSNENLSLKRQIDQMKQVEEFNAALETLKNDAKNWTNTPERAAQWLRANSTWAISVLVKRNANFFVSQRNQNYDLLIKDIAAHLKSCPSLINKEMREEDAAYKVWAAGCNTLVQKILGLQTIAIQVDKVIDSGPINS